MTKELESMLIHFAKQDNVIVLTESTSNVHHPDFIENTDRCIITNLGDEAAKALMPDLLVTMGGAIVSKRIKVYSKIPPCCALEYSPLRCYNGHLSIAYHCNIYAADSILTLLSQYHIPVNSDYKNNWQQLQQQKGNTATLNLKQ